jgi:hypothetical protein
MTDPESLKPLSMREERFAQGLLEGKTQEQAAIDAGYSPASARTLASAKMRDLSFRDRLREHALAQGIGIEYALKKLDHLMNARAVALGGKDKDLVIELGDDGATQAKGTDMFLKVMGAYPDPRLEANVNVAATVIVRSGDMLAPDPFSDGAVVDGEAREISDGA